MQPAQLSTPLPTETSFNKAFCCGIDVSNVGVVNQGFQSNDDLMPFVGCIPELRFGQQRMKDSEIGVS
jgi:hypothetical protein